MSRHSLELQQTQQEKMLEDMLHTDTCIRTVALLDSEGKPLERKREGITHAPDDLVAKAYEEVRNHLKPMLDSFDEYHGPTEYVLVKKRDVSYVGILFDQNIVVFSFSSDYTTRANIGIIVNGPLKILRKYKP